MENGKQQLNIKYLSGLAARFAMLKDGIEMNKVLWNSFNITPSTVEKHIEDVYNIGIEIEQLKETLSGKLAEARELRDEKKKTIEQFVKRAIGLHADSEDKLAEYGIEK